MTTLQPRSIEATTVHHVWPGLDAGMSAPQACAAMRAALANGGHDPRDFELSLDEESQLNALLGISERLLTVRRRSNGEERLYSAGAHTPWLAELLHDVASGLFGRCAQ